MEAPRLMCCRTDYALGPPLNRSHAYGNKILPFLAWPCGRCSRLQSQKTKSQPQNCCAQAKPCSRMCTQAFGAMSELTPANTARHKHA
jgi:hypothetical protein